MVTFGFASDGVRLSRFSKGDTSFGNSTVGTNSHSGDIAHSTLFACGDDEGRVHIWDLRNVKQPATQVSPRPPAVDAGPHASDRSSASRTRSPASSGTNLPSWHLRITTTWPLFLILIAI